MSKISKTVALILTLTIAMSCLISITVKPANAQTIPKPSVPEFTVNYVDRSYDVPIEYHTSTDPFTGEEVTTSSGGNHVTSKTIDITIKNIPYSDIYLDDEKVIKLYYAIRTKGHFADWTPVASGGYSFTRVLASNSDSTIVTLRIGNRDNDILMDYADVVIQEGGQEDFQVNAQAGHKYMTYAGLYPMGSEFEQYAESGWSNTQTITIPAYVPITSNSTSYPSSTLPNMGPTASSIPNNADLTLTSTLIIIAIFVVTVVSLLLYVRHLKRNIPEK